MKKNLYTVSAVFMCICIIIAFVLYYRTMNGSEIANVSPQDAPPDVLFSITPSPYYSPVSTRYGYDSLTSEEQRQVYNAIVRRIASITDEPTGDKYTNSSGYFMHRVFAPRLTPRELSMVIDCVREDYPETFWITGNCRHGTDENGQYFIQLISYISQSEMNSSILQFKKSVSDMLQQIPSGLSEFERELYIHDWMLKQCQYEDKGYDIDKNDLYTGSAYGAFIGGRTICEGYARGFQLLLKMVGIKSRLLTGSSLAPTDGKGRAHIWNIALIDGNWYHVDVTWDDSLDTEHRYDYFNLSTEKMLSDHVLDPISDNASDNDPDAYDRRFNRPYPECTELSMNYYVHEAVTIGSVSQEAQDQLTHKLLETFKNGDTFIPVYFPNSDTAEKCRHWVTQNAFFQSTRNVNDTLGYEAMLENEVYYTESSTFDNVLIFQLPIKK